MSLRASGQRRTRTHVEIGEKLVAAQHFCNLDELAITRGQLQECAGEGVQNQEYLIVVVVPCEIPSSACLRVKRWS